MNVLEVSPFPYSGIRGRRKRMAENASVAYADGTVTVTDYRNRSHTFTEPDKVTVCHGWALTAGKRTLLLGSTPGNFVQAWACRLFFYQEGSPCPDFVLPGGWLRRDVETLEGFTILPGWWSYEKFLPLTVEAGMTLTETRKPVSDSKREGFWGSASGGIGLLNTHLPLSP